MMFVTTQDVTEFPSSQCYSPTASHHKPKVTKSLSNQDHQGSNQTQHRQHVELNNQSKSTGKNFRAAKIGVQIIWKGPQVTAGRLSHFILPHEQLETSLEWFQSHLDKHHSDLTILHRDLTYYFRDGSFHVTALPLSAPDDDPRHHMKIRLDFEAVIYSSDAEYYTVVHRLRDLSSHEVINLQSSALTLRSRDSPSCALMLIEGTLRQIQTTCKYDVILAPLPTSMFKIDEHWILLSNIPEMTLTCPYSPPCVLVLGGVILLIVRPARGKCFRT